MAVDKRHRLASIGADWLHGVASRGAPGGSAVPGIYMAALLTGLRRGELRQIEARDIDLAEGTLTARAEVSKTKEKVMMPLHDELREPLRTRISSLKLGDRVFRRHPE